MTNYQTQNILLIIPSLDFGGAQRSISKVSKAFSKKYNVYVCTFNLSLGVAFPHGGKLLDLNVPEGRNLFSKIINFIIRCIRLSHFKRLYHIDTSISYLEGANYVNLLSRYKDKVIISVRGSKVLDMNITGLLGKIRLNILLPLLYRLADQIVALSHGIKAELVDRFMLNPGKITVIYNFYNLDQIKIMAKDPIPKKFEFIFNNTTLISAGRLSPEKGFDVLLNVFFHLKKSKPNVRLIILGDGPLRDSLFHKSELFSLKTFSVFDNNKGPIGENDVYFLGYQENPFQFFSKSTVFILTSHAEGGPNVLSEAMACGIPVIATDCPSGPRERIAPKSKPSHKPIIEPEFAEFGILLPPLNGNTNDPALLTCANVLDKVLSDSQIMSKYGEKSLLRANDFSQSLIIRQWYKLI